MPALACGACGERSESKRSESKRSEGLPRQPLHLTAYGVASGGASG